MQSRIFRKSRKSAWVKSHPAISIIETSEHVGTVPELEVFENSKTIEYLNISILIINLFFCKIKNS